MQRYTKIYRKETDTDRQNFLHVNSKHPISLKNSISYSYVLKTSSFIGQKGYKSDLLHKHISAIVKLDQNEMLKKKVRVKLKQICIPLTLLTIAFVQTSVK